MAAESIPFIIVSTLFINNFVFSMFLGLCPFLGVSAKLNTAWPMGVATTFVMWISSLSAYLLNRVLLAVDLEQLRLIAYIAVIAAAVQLVEMTMKKFSPTLFRALGIYLPLITTNCAVLGVALFQTTRDYNFLQSMAFSLAAGAGFTLALVLMAGLRERLDLVSLPKIAQGSALSLLLAGLLSLSFMGFAGLGG
jgi:Na+-translocating ferredoxin:NAD+ oxidoreductase subunit A